MKKLYYLTDQVWKLAKDLQSVVLTDEQAEKELKAGNIVANVFELLPEGHPKKPVAEKAPVKKAPTKKVTKKKVAKKAAPQED
jgi:hypothetical protein